MGFPCAVTADLNRYLAQLDEDDHWQEAVDARQEELIADGGDCITTGFKVKVEPITRKESQPCAA